MNKNPSVPHDQPPSGQPDCSTLHFPAVAQHPQQARVQAATTPAYNPQWAIPPPPEQSANCDHGSQRQEQYQQFQYQYYASPTPVAQRFSQPAIQSSYNSYQPTPGYPQLFVPHPVASRQPQLPYPYLQPHQHPQNQLRRTTPEYLIPVLDGLYLNRQAPLLQPHFQLPPLAQTTNDQDQRPDTGDGIGGPDRAQVSANKGSTARNCEGMNDRRSARGLMLGNQSRMSPGDGTERTGQFDGDVHAHGSDGNFHKVENVQGGGRNQFPDVVEPTTGPVATQFQNAHDFNINGNPRFTNIGTNHNVNFYGGIHGVEKLEKFVSLPALHDSSAQDPERCCHMGTRENILGQLRHWIDNPNLIHPIFWLYGPAGAGKSAIAQTIAHGYNQGEVAATFFFFRSDAVRNDGNRLFPTIAWQLAFSIPATKEIIIDVLDKTPHLPTKGVETQFEYLVAHVFRSTNNVASRMRHSAPVVIIDGVDECSDEQLQRRFLTVIGNAVKECRVPLRFLISSRPEALIEDTLNLFKNVTLRIDLATVNDANHDIEKYLVDKFSGIASKQGLEPTWPSQEVIREIVFKSSGNFILASTLVRFIGDEDFSAESQLDIVQKLKPRGTMSPFALLDELYLEILKRQRDQDFLKTYLALFIGRSSIEGDNLVLREDDAMLMNVPEKELHIKLRRMRSMLKFEPFIDVYHKSFLDFLQDSSRSGQYYVSRQEGQKRYLKLIVDSVVRHVSVATEHPNRHKTCTSSPRFKYTVARYYPRIVLPANVWQEVLKPLLDLRDKILKIPKLWPCRVTQIMHELQLHLTILRILSHHTATKQALKSNTNKTGTNQGVGLVTEAIQDVPETDLDNCLSALLACLPKTTPACDQRTTKLNNVTITQSTVDSTTIYYMSSLLAFNCAKTARRVRSISDAQKLIDLIDLMTNNQTLLSQCGPDARRKATRLASEILAKVPLLPTSISLNRPAHYVHCSLSPVMHLLELAYQSIFISRILDHNYIVPQIGTYNRHADRLTFIRDNITDESIEQWLRRSKPSLLTRIQVMLEVARTIQYIHSMDVALHSECIQPVGIYCIFDDYTEHFFLNSNLRSKFLFTGLFTRWHKDASNYGYDESALLEKCTYKSNISAFADLFHSVCFVNKDVRQDTIRIRVKERAKKLIERCRAVYLTNWPTMQDVVNEMERWNLS